jgi:hypothetical protein
MGVDGHLTAGFVNVPTEQNYSLMADSPSNFFFDQIYLKKRNNKTKYVINGVVLLTAVGTKFTMTRGFLTTVQPLPTRRRSCRPAHTITWEIRRPVAELKCAEPNRHDPAQPREGKPRRRQDVRRHRSPGAQAEEWGCAP